MKPTTKISLWSYTNRKNAPRDVYDMIKREVQKDELYFYEKTPSIPPPKKELENNLKKSVGLLILFKTAIMQFRP